MSAFNKTPFGTRPPSGVESAADMARAADTERPSGPRLALRQRRIDEGLTRGELAQRIGLSKSALAGIENGHHATSLVRAEAIAVELGARVADLFDVQPCGCGCGELTPGRFVKGHNAGNSEHRTGCKRGHVDRRARLGIPEEKVCKKCGRMFTRSDVPRQSLAHWIAREHCSFECAHGPAVQQRHCRRCGTLFRPYDNSPTRLFCTRRCAQKNRVAEVVRDGRRLVADAFIDYMPGKARRIVKLKLTKSPGAPPKYHPDTRALVCELRTAGRSWNEIAAETGVPRDTAREMAGARQRRS
jgi:DNA-binding XRE family transcriptional regulator